MILTEEECCSRPGDGFTRVANGMTCWSLLTQVTLQKDEIIRSNIIVPGISILRSLAEFDCKSIQPLVDFRMSLDNGSTL